MTTLEVLIAGRGYIDEPPKWTKGAYARAASGSEVDVFSKKAVCYCARGAIEVAARAANTSDYGGAIAALMHAIPRGCRLRGIPTYQDRDETTHADVMAMFDRAIADERAKEETNGN
jgi:hypothetical protein